MHTRPNGYRLSMKYFIGAYIVFGFAPLVFSQSLTVMFYYVLAGLLGVCIGWTHAKS